MKITDVEVIEFKVRTRGRRTRWGYGEWGEEHDTTQAITKISTDDGAEGYMLGATAAPLKRR